jgi:hypothetical protein
MIEIMLGYYLGLFIFVINGLQLVAIQQRQRELAAKEESIRKLLTRLKLRR